MRINYIKINSFLVSILPITLIFSIFISDLIISLTSLCFLIYVIKKNKLSIFNSLDFKIFFIFYLLLIFSSLNSNYVNYSFFKTLPYLRFGVFMIVIKYLVLSDKQFLKYLFNSTLLAYFILFVGLALQISGFEYLYKHVNGFRYSSFFKDELILGSYLIKTLPIFLTLFFFFDYKKKYCFILIFFTLVMIFFSGERSTYIQLGVFLFFLIFFTQLIKSKVDKLKIIILFLLFLLISLFSFPKVKFQLITKTAYQLSLIKPDKDYVEFDLGNKTHVAVAREKYFIPLKYYLMFSTGIKIFKDQPFFGSGTKTFRIACKNKKYYLKENYPAFIDKPDNYYEGYTGVDGCSSHPHNYYIQLLAETGILTFFILISLFFYFFAMFFKSQIIYKKIFYLSFFIQLMPLAFSGSFFSNFINIIFYLYLGLSNIKKNNELNK